MTDAFTDKLAKDFIERQDALDLSKEGQSGESAIKHKEEASDAAALDLQLVTSINGTQTVVDCTPTLIELGDQGFKPLIPPTPHAAARVRSLEPTSFISRASQYSGTVDLVDQVGKLCIGVQLVKHSNDEDSGKLIDESRKVQTVGIINEEDLEYEVESDYSSVRTVELPTIMKNLNPAEREAARKSPDAQYRTNIEAPVPPRSRRRPMSESFVSLKPSPKKSSHRMSTSSTQDWSVGLTELMHDASSLCDLQKEIQPSHENEHEEFLDVIGCPKQTKTSLKSRNFSLKNSRPIRDTSQYSDLEQSRTELADLSLFTKLEERTRETKRQEPLRSLPPRPSGENVIKAKTPRRVPPQSQDINHLQSPNQLCLKAGPDRGQVDRDQLLPQLSNQCLTEENEYSDIGEVSLASSPQIKLASKSTRHRRPTSRKKSVKAKGTSLRPFSYSTLVSLLESMNGTVIGEEFNQLNLPYEEKRLMEKIIDSLSRLTLDMVLDSKRYDIGICRLELALRVLEGFE